MLLILLGLLSFPAIVCRPTHYTGKYPNNTETVGVLTYQTFRSPPVSLRSGQVANSYWDLDWIEEGAIRSITTRIVDESGKAVGSDQLYVHHWFFMERLNGQMADPGELSAGLCQVISGYGTGAELNGQELLFPHPLAIIWKKELSMIANLHFIRTTNVKDLQPCIECRCPDSTPERPHGSHYCDACKHGAQCWGMANSTLNDARNFYLEYTIGFAPLTKDVVPAMQLTLDVTSTNTSDCAIEFDLTFPGGKPVTNISDSVVPQDFNITLVASHLHIGGFRLVVEHYREGAKIGDVCVTDAVYDNDDNHLVAMPFCLYTLDDPYPIKKGDILRTVTEYDTRTVPGGVGYHEGLMGLVWIFGQASDVQGLLDYKSALNDGASTDFLQHPELNMGLEIIPPGSDPNVRNFILTCATGSWCALAIGGDKRMSNATAFIYGQDPETKSFGVQQRKLGEHNSGAVLDPTYPSKFETSNGLVTINFDVKNDVYGFMRDGSKNICFLFAHGTSDMFSYHGPTNRGVSCFSV